MKTRTVPITKLAFLCTALAGALLTFSNNAGAFSIREASSRHSDRSTYINNLIGMALRSNEMANRQYFRSDTSTPHTFVIDRALGYRETITIPIIGGVPKPGSGAVPDGGITAMLLGAALGALGIARRYLKT